MTLRIGTRGSALARAQAADVARRLEAHGFPTETVIISTAGDRTTDRRFSDVGAFGIFVREIEDALLDRRIDLAVHSYKDLPSRGPDALVVAAVPERVDAADVLLIRAGSRVPEAGPLPVRDGALVGTSAARRAALLRSLRPDLSVGMLRGNVPTRIAALADGRFDAIVLAAAGLLRLERCAEPGDRIIPDGILRVRLDPALFTPAPAQGAIAVQARRDTPDVLDAAALIHDAGSGRTLHAERLILARAEGGCTLPFGAWCEGHADGSLTLHASLGREDGSVARVVRTGDDAESLAEATWRELAQPGIPA
jgi:hydroxymethylbilane synthase